MNIRTLIISTTLALCALTVGPPASSANGDKSPYDSDLGVAVPYGETRDTAQAERLARWASAHELTVANPSRSLRELYETVTDPSDPYPGSKEVTTLVQNAFTQEKKASEMYTAQKLAAGDALAKTALANLDTARTAMEADYAAALAQAGPSTAYRMNEGGREPAFVEIASLASAATVVAWIDGDTVLTDKGKVRLVGIDTPEVSDNCSKADGATRNANTIAPPGSTIVLRDPLSVQDQDRYDRVLRYVETYPRKDEPTIDIGYAQIKDALALARYDGLDGFASHPRQDAYRAASQQDLARDAACYLPLVALFGDGDDGKPGPYMLTKDQQRTSRDFLTDDWTSVGSSTKGALNQDRAQAKTAAEAAAKARAEAKAKAAAKSRADAKAKAAAQARAKAKAKAEDKARAKAKAKAKSDRRSSSNSDSSKGTSSNPYPGYTGPRCYAPGGKTWRPC